MTSLNNVLKVVKVRPSAVIPAYQTEFSSGADLHADLDSEITISPGSLALIPSGICLEIPDGLEGQVRSRSGLALKHGLTVLNSPGTIDQDYRGEVKVILYNAGSADFVVLPSMRIAQLVIAPVNRVKFESADLLSNTKRGSEGFGSTGAA